MDVTALLSELGGTSTRAGLMRWGASDRELADAVQEGTVVRVGPGQYAVPGVRLASEVAATCHGVLGQVSAALAHRWPVAREPDRPVVIVPRSRRVPGWQRRLADIRYADLDAADVLDGVTTERRTLLDCLRSLPLTEALAVADSALRVGGVSSDDLVAVAEASPRTGRRRALRVAGAADARAATPFESVVRAIGLDVRGLRLVPQVQVLPGITPDLVDEQLGLVVECDSWTYHAEKTAFTRDQERFNDLLLSRWLVLRFGTIHALDRPSYVRQMLETAVGRLAG